MCSLFPIIWLQMLKRFSLLDNIDDAKWNEFVYRHPNGTIFQTPMMQQLYHAIEGYTPFVLAAVNCSGEIKGLLAGCIIQEKGFMNWLSSRAIVTGGPLLTEPDHELINMLLTGYHARLKKKVIYSQFRNMNRTEQLEEVFRENGFNYTDHLTVMLDLHSEKEQLWQKIHKKKRQNIRRAGRRGVVVKHLNTADEIEQVSELIRITYKRIQLPGPPSGFFQEAMKILGSHIQFFGAFYGSDMIAAKIYLTYKGLVYDWYSGSDKEFSYLCANDLLAWQGINWSKENGFGMYDFAGAGHPSVPYGVRNFKVRFGGELTNFGRYTAIHRTPLYYAGVLGINIKRKLLIKTQ